MILTEEKELPYLILTAYMTTLSTHLGFNQRGVGLELGECL